MRKVVFVAIFALIFISFVSAQENASQIIQAAGPFATAEEAANFANSLPEIERYSAKFLCEYAQGAPLTAAYRVIYNSTLMGIRADASWRAQEFETLADALEFTKLAPIIPQFVSCFNPNKNPSSTTITVFYRQTDYQYSYRTAEETFGTAADAAAYANLRLTGNMMVWFVPQLFVGKQTESAWNIVYAENGPKCHSSCLWTAIENKQNGLLQIEDLQNMTNNWSWFESRPVYVFSAWRPTSRLVLFRFENREDVLKAELEIPTTVYASRRLLSQMGTDYLLKILDLDNEIIFQESERGARLIYERNILFAPEADGDKTEANPILLAKMLPREKNTLAILFVDMPLRNPDIEAEGKSVVELVGPGWIIVWVYPPLLEILPPEKRLLHGLGHLLGAGHSSDPNSVMCSAAFTDGCSKNSLWFDKQSKASIIGGAKAIKKIGLDTYLRLLFH